ncbi:hypothetical protein [Clostridium cochlearium]|uniref:Uncharacterized protein n=1 Tax=Clostridium cochlearium TaxID=1494 RepID=A0A2X2Y593_CLOCO|nr:hypothetical protein [Clostridium cochlearium]SQB33640.1 Uncharacterised protein [Clostridium cochlearium]
MPLHNVPLCKFSYARDFYNVAKFNYKAEKVGLGEFKYTIDIIGGATFKYDTTERIKKNESKLFYKNNRKEIDKLDSKMFYSTKTKIDKNNIIKGLYGSKNKIDKNIEKELVPIDKEVAKENLLSLNNIDRNIDILKEKNLLDTNVTKIDKNNTKQFKNIDATKEVNKSNIINLENYKITKDINIKNNKELKREEEQGLDINSNINVGIARKQELDITNAIHLDKAKERGLDIATDKYTDINTIRNIDIKNNSISIDKDNIKKIDLLSNNYLNREIKKEIDKNIITELMYKANNFRLTKYNLTGLEREKVKDIINALDTKLFYINTLKKISKINSIGLNKNIARDVFTSSNNYLDRIIDTSIYKEDIVSLGKNIARNIYKGQMIGLNKSTINIYNTIDAYELNKFDTSIYVPYELKGLNKFRTNIYIPYTATDLEVLKRWWVLGATSPYDKKILPYDYNYLKKPLSINRRDREYGCLIDQDKHPISFMPYLENNKGIDLGYGLEEINLSIEIMLDMVNIVGMIVQHSASQFANCSGQEAIEFIMEVLLDWLNLDTTIQEMNNKGSREHYLRCYRWIRWEAEKIWFTADKDHSMDKMMGIKYAGMLFANLLDYMKYHHFDIVPLWRNLKYMDIERHFNRIVQNGDIMENLDKLKSKRHYYIETQNFERKNIFGE